MNRTHLFLLCVALTTVATSCGGNERSGPVRTQKVQAGGVSLPGQVIGLQVHVEDVRKKVAEVRRPYFEGVGLFSLREGDLLRGTLQVSKLSSLADPDSPSFRSGVIDLLGSSQPQPVRVGKETVYVTSGNEQNIFAWFEGRGFFVLTVHKDYEFPRTLLREVLKQEQKI